MAGILGSVSGRRRAREGPTPLPVVTLAATAVRQAVRGGVDRPHTSRVVPPTLFEFVALPLPLAVHLALVLLPLLVPRSLHAGPLSLQFQFDLVTFLARLFAFGLAFEFQSFLQFAVERGAFDKRVGLDAEGVAHPLIGLLLRLRDLVSLVRLDGPRRRGGGLLLGEKTLAECSDLRLDLVRFDAVVLERDLKFEALGFDCAFAFVFEDVLVGCARGERLAVQVGRRIARAVSLAEAVAGGRFSAYPCLVLCARVCVQLTQTCLPGCDRTCLTLAGWTSQCCCLGMGWGGVSVRVRVSSGAE